MPAFAETAGIAGTVLGAVGVPTGELSARATTTVVGKGGEGRPVPTGGRDGEPVPAGGSV